MNESQGINRMVEPRYKAATEYEYLSQLETYIPESVGSWVEKLRNFAKFTPRQDIARFLGRYELFKKVLDTQGSIIECGVFLGGGVMSFAQLSAIFEPVNYQRQVIGFDTFEGFPELHEKDIATGTESILRRKGALATHAHDDILRAATLFDANRFVNHIPKVRLIKGDATETIPIFLEQNPQIVVSLLYLDFDLYAPTKVAIEHFLPRMPKGAIIAFDELNYDDYPGETTALLETIGISSLRIQRFSFDSKPSYAIID